jgi:cardiolipin synthase
MLNMETILTIIAAVVFIVEGIGILAAFHAVMTAKTSQGAIAWGISLVTFPWLALPLYAVFGRSKFHGYVLLRHVKDERIHHIIDQCSINAAEKTNSSRT